MNYGFACIFWELAGLIFLMIGLYDYLTHRNRTVGLFSNLNRPVVTDVHAYNQAVGKLWITFFLLFEVLGTVILFGNDRWILYITILGTCIASLLLILIYRIMILRRYRVKVPKQKHKKEKQKHV